jgi:hypothetical protein
MCNNAGKNVWDIEVTNEFAEWLNRTTDDQFVSIAEAVDALGIEGPALGRPLVDTIKSSRHSNMKELRPRGGNIRILFAFDPRRSAILLLGGDKSGRWNDWYRRAVPRADELYDEYLVELRKEDIL